MKQMQNAKLLLSRNVMFAENIFGAELIFRVYWAKKFRLQFSNGNVDGDSFSPEPFPKHRMLLKSEPCSEGSYL